MRETLNLRDAPKGGREVIMRHVSADADGAGRGPKLRPILDGGLATGPSPGSRNRERVSAFALRRRYTK